MSGGREIIYFIIILSIIIIDQMAKKKAIAKLEEGKLVTLLKKSIQFTLVKNSGAAFSILRGRQTLLKAVTIPLTLLLLAYLLYITVTGRDYVLLGLSLSFIIGGAIGNLIDRIRFNYVIDYVRFNINKFPVFNIADIFIFIGSVIFIVYAFRYHIPL